MSYLPTKSSCFNENDSNSSVVYNLVSDLAENKTKNYESIKMEQLQEKQQR